MSEYICSTAAKDLSNVKDVPLNRTFDLQGRVRVQIFTLEDVYVCNLSRTVGVRRRGVQRQKRGRRSPLSVGAAARGA